MEPDSDVLAVSAKGWWQMGDGRGVDAAKVDFFISYTAVDEKTAEWIAWVLEDAGYRTVIQAWDFQPGREFVTEMQQALVGAQRVLAVLSPAYLDSRFARAEWNAALASDPTGAAGTLLPVRVADVTLQGLDLPRVYVDLVGLPEAEATARLLAGIKAERAKPAVAPGYPDRLRQPPPPANLRGPVVAGPAVDREFWAHWDPRARGVAQASDPGWYFAGRTQVLRELVTWLSDPDLDHRVRVVTGDPGSGKSAVLARLVTLADPQVRQRVPPSVLTAAPAGTLPAPGGIDAAIHARNKTLPDVLAALATATDAGNLDAAAASTSPEQQVRSLVDQLIARPQRRVIILDALDEATDPQQLTSQLVRPLLAAAAQSGLRLVVGTRRPLVDTLGDRIVVLDLDDPTYLDEADLAKYVTRVLLAEHEPDRPTPYRHRPELAQQVARAVAGRASKTFLLARIVAQSLVNDDHPVDTSRLGWELELPATVGLAFEGYLERFGPNQPRARDLLGALAFAEGAGLPEQFWAPAACAVSGTGDYTDDDVGWVVSAAADYLLQVPEYGRLVYRLYHEALAEHLRSHDPGPEPQRRLTQALYGLVPARGAADQPAWEAADPYLRAHLASHAAAAGQLDELLIDPGFLLAADPARLLAVLPAATRPDGKQAADVYRGALYQLRGRDLAEAAAQLQLAARQYDADDLAERIGRLGVGLPWSVPWAHYRRAHSHLVLGTHSGGVSVVAVTALDGRPMAITGGYDGTVRVWDLAIGTQLHQLPGHSGGVTALAVTALDGRPIAITGSDDGDVRVWDLTIGTLLHQLSGHTDRVTALAVTTLESHPIAITGSSDGDDTVRVWDLAIGTQLHQLSGHSGGVSVVAVTALDGLPMAITGSSDGDATVRVWDLTTGTQLRAPAPDRLWSWIQRLRRRIWPTFGSFSVAVTTLDGRPIAITGSGYGDVRVWDLTTGTQLHQLSGHTGGVDAVAVTTLDGRPIAITGSYSDGTVRVWDLTTGTQLHQLTGHSGGVSVVAVTTLDGRPMAVTGSYGDDTVRVWDLTTGTQLHQLSGHTSGINAVAVTTLDGRPIAITGSAASDASGSGTWPRDATPAHSDAD